MFCNLGTVALILALFIQIAFGQCPQVITTSAGDIKLSNFQGPFQLKTGIHTFNLDICRNLPTPCSVPEEGMMSSPAIQTYHEGCYYLGKLENAQVKLIDPANPEGGVSIRYPNGQFVNPGAVGSKRRETSVTLVCDRKQKQIVLECDTANECESHTQSALIYSFTLRGEAACPGADKPSGGGGTKKPLGEFGFGGLFIVLAIVGLIIYFIVGLIIKKVKYQSTGLNLIPNLVFWKALPFLIIDGFKFLFLDILYLKIIKVIVEKVKNRGSGHESV